MVVRILIVEDEKRMAQTIQGLLRHQNYLSDVALDGEAGLDCILSGIYDLVILDIMLPKLDGFQVLAAMRAQGVQIPVLLLTARCSVDDRIDGLNRGADYFLAKPFSAEELLACVRALLRRPRELDSSLVQFGDLTLDMDSGNLTCQDSSVCLNRRELELLRILMRNGGTPVTREFLLVKVWGIEASPESNVVEAYMSFLRKKLTFVHSQIAIVSLRRIGYYLTMQGEGL
jgi:DNA-binding response OmpR family regulator